MTLPVTICIVVFAKISIKDTAKSIIYIHFIKFRIVSNNCISALGCDIAKKKGLYCDWMWWTSEEAAISLLSNAFSVSITKEWLKLIW